MNENEFLLVGDKFMLEMHLKQSGFTYSACGPFAENKERFHKLKLALSIIWLMEILKN